MLIHFLRDQEQGQTPPQLASVTNVGGETTDANRDMPAKVIEVRTERM
jgi:hypothetical protein